MCHSHKLITQQNLNRRNWNLIIKKMQKEHGLWKLQKKDTDIILNYLSKYFGVKKIESNINILNMRPINPLP